MVTDPHYLLKKMIIKCVEAIESTTLGTNHIAAIERVVGYFKSLISADQPIARSDERGSYSFILAAPRPVECTIIGIMLFDKEGKQIKHMCGPFDRAIARGDMTGHMKHHSDTYSDYGKLFDRDDAERRSHNTIGCIKITQPLFCITDELHFVVMYLKYVLGVDAY